MHREENFCLELCARGGGGLKIAQARTDLYSCCTSMNCTPPQVPAPRLNASLQQSQYGGRPCAHTARSQLKCALSGTVLTYLSSPSRPTLVYILRIECFSGVLRVFRCKLAAILSEYSELGSCWPGGFEQQVCGGCTVLGVLHEEREAGAARWQHRRRAAQLPTPPTRAPRDQAHAQRRQAQHHKSSEARSSRCYCLQLVPPHTTALRKISKSQ